MVRVDFDQVDDAENFVSVPNGTYPCQVAEIRIRQGEDGVERWGVRWVVADGPFAGRTAAWDSLSFEPRGLRRAKLILHRLGVPVDGPQEVRPSDVEGRRALVTVYARERTDAATGRRIIANRVPFAGVEPEPEAGSNGATRHGGEPPQGGAELAAAEGDDEGLEPADGPQFERRR